MRKQGILLEHSIHPPLVGRHVVDALALKEQVAAVCLFKAGDNAQHGGLAAAGRAQQR